MIEKASGTTLEIDSQTGDVIRNSTIHLLGYDV